MAFGKLTWELPAVAKCVAACRHTLKAYMAEFGVCEEDIDNVQIILGEACSNVVRHAYSSPGQSYKVQVRFAPGKILLDVVDKGMGFDRANPCPLPKEDSCGMGLAIISQLSNRSSVVSRIGRGTAVHVEYGLRLGDTSGCAELGVGDRKPKAV